MRNTQGNLFVTIVMGDSKGSPSKGSGWWYPDFPKPGLFSFAEYPVACCGDEGEENKEKQAVRKLSEAVLAEGWKLLVKPGAHQGLFHKRPWWP